MKNIKKLLISLFVVCSMIANMFVSVMVYADDNDDTETTKEYGMGLRIPSEEEYDKFINSLSKIEDVKLNKYAVSRINAQLVTAASEDSELYDEDKAVDFGEEVKKSGDDSVYIAAEDWEDEALDDIRFIDNSTQICFPPIGNQGGTSSCVTWAFGYYQLTNNIGLVRGYDNKTSYEHVINPMWIYNLINDGENQGTFYADAENVMKNLGAATCGDCYDSKSPKNSDYDTWFPSYDIWNNALKNKIKDFDYIDVYDADGIDRIKKQLLNGYVLSFGTRADAKLRNWMYKKGETSLGTPNICYYVKNATPERINENGEYIYPGHSMTIVGFDDDAWVDVNGNGIKEEAETGAFKIANSWGRNQSGIKQNDNGCIWLLYDAIYDSSNIPDFDPDERIASFCDHGIFFIEPYETEYTPLAVSSVELSTAKRNQISISLGISSSALTTPEMSRSVVEISDNKYESRLPFNETGGYKNFSGIRVESTGKFVFDYTELIKEYYENHVSDLKSNPNIRLYLTLHDNTNDSYKSSICSYSIEELKKTGVYSTKNTLPLTANGSSVTVYSDVELLPVISKGNVTVDFSYPIKESCVNKTNIKMTNSKNESVDINFSLGNENKTVDITKSGNIFNKNTYYTLSLDKSIRTIGGNTLGTDVKKLYYFID